MVVDQAPATPDRGRLHADLGQAAAQLGNPAELAPEQCHHATGQTTDDQDP